VVAETATGKKTNQNAKKIVAVFSGAPLMISLRSRIPT
jgi:hypothetical protein